MGFHKINAQEEIRKAVEKKPDLATYIKQADTQYKLIKEIVEYRKAAGITQREVAMRSGLTQQMVSRMEKIDNSPTLENFLRYLLALGLELKIDRANIVGVSSDEEAFCVL